MKISKIVPFLVFVSGLTLLYGMTFILIDFIDTPVNGIKDILIVAIKWGYMTVMTSILLYFLSVNKYFFSFFFPLLSVLCATLSYYKLTFNVELTQMVIDLALVNDFRTSFDAVSWQLFLLLLAVLFLSVWIVIYRFKKITVSYSWIQLCIAFALLLIIDNTYVLSKPLVRHTPYSIYYSFQSYFENRRIIAKDRPELNGKVHSESDSITVVFVLLIVPFNFLNA